MSHSEPVRVAVLATHPIQYQAPLWRRLAARPDLRVHVFFGSDLSVRGYRDEGFGVKVQWDVPLVAGYEHTFLSRDPALQRLTFWKPRASGLRQHLRAFKPDVVLLTAYNSLFWIESLLVARSMGLSVVMRHEASDAAVVRTRFKGFIRDVALRLFYSQVSGFAAIGTQARAHLLRLGVAANKIGSAPYCIDSDQIERQVAEWLPRRTKLRAALGIGEGDCVLIFAGKLIPKKQPLLIFDALQKLPSSSQERFHLIVMGDGELRDEVQRRGRQVLGPRFHMAGFVNQSELGRWYARADCLVLPSQKGAGETWGLVVNEALQFGLPAVVSDGVGCHPDLLDTTTGRVFAADSVADLARVLEEACEEFTGMRPAVTQACVTKVARFSLEAAALGLKKAFLQAAAFRDTNQAI